MANPLPLQMTSAAAWRKRYADKRENDAAFAIAWQMRFERKTYDDLPKIKWEILGGDLVRAK